MRKKILPTLLIRLRICIVAFLLVLLSLFLFSFTVQKMKNDFLKQLGINQATADQKIGNSILGGYLDHYGIRNMKNILLNDRTAVINELAAYAKQYVQSDAFKKEYAALKERNKPEAMKVPETPEEMRASLIRSAKEFVAGAEDNVKKANAQTKKIFEQTLELAKKNLKDAEDPNNQMIRSYTKNYEEMKKLMKQSWDNSMKDWETKYPGNHLLYVKVRLQEFLDATEGIDYNAATFDKNGKKYFVKPEYEHKDSRWKMAFRAGKEAVEPARAFARQWISEIH